MIFINIEGYRGNCDIFNPISIDSPEEKNYCPQTYFAINNIFSELITESERLQARTNLDISWKNLLGEVESAPGLKDFVLDQLTWNNIHGDTTITESLVGDELIIVNQDGENKAVKASTLIKDAKEIIEISIGEGNTFPKIKVKDYVNKIPVITESNKNIYITKTHTFVEGSSCRDIFVVAYIDLLTTAYVEIKYRPDAMDEDILIELKQDNLYIYPFNPQGSGNKFLADNGQYLDVGINNNTLIVDEVNDDDLILINPGYENKAVSAAALIKGAKELFVITPNSEGEFPTILTKDYLNRGMPVIKAGEVYITKAFTRNYYDGGSLYTADYYISVYPMHSGEKGGILKVTYRSTSPDEPISFIFSPEENIIPLFYDGDGTKFLSDDGTYKSLDKSINWSILGAPLITFTFDGVQYQAEEGMSFMQWCDSKYNTTKNTSNILMYNAEILYWKDMSSGLQVETLVDKDTIIVNNGTY